MDFAHALNAAQKMLLHFAANPMPVVRANLRSRRDKPGRVRLTGEYVLVPHFNNAAARARAGGNINHAKSGDVHMVPVWEGQVIV